MRRTCVAPCPRVRYVYRQVDPAAPPPPWLMPNTSAQANEKEKNIFLQDPLPFAILFEKKPATVTV